MPVLSAIPTQAASYRSLSAGFTLVEALVVVSLTAVLAALAVPSFRDFSTRTAIRAQVSDLSGTLRLARSEAIKRGRTVLLCRTGDGLAENPACETGSDWSSGWVMRQGDQAIRVQPAYANSGGIVAEGIGNLQFLPTGSVVGINGSFTFRPKLPEADESYARLSRRICLNAQGVTREC